MERALRGARTRLLPAGGDAGTQVVAHLVRVGVGVRVRARVRVGVRVSAGRGRPTSALGAAALPPMRERRSPPISRDTASPALPARVLRPPG